MVLLLRFTVLFVAVVFASTLQIGLEANWTEAPFALQLIESVAEFDESLYIGAAKALFRGEEDNSDFDDVDDEEDDEHTGNSNEVPDGPKSDRENYESVAKVLSETQLGLVNLHLVNKLASPRIQAHYDFFNNEFDSEALKTIEKKCATDSFGEPLIDPLKAWVKYGNKYYCSESDLFALQTDTFSESVMPFDRVIGSDESKPLLVLYGDPSCSRFAGMFHTLMSFAEYGSIRFVWRYVPSSFGASKIPGFGVTITSKSKSNKNAPQVEGDILKALIKIKKDGRELFDLEDDKLSTLSINIVSLVLQQSDPVSQLALLKEILHNLPLYGPYLGNVEASESSRRVEKHALANEKKGAAYESVGLYINGAATHRLQTDLPNIIDKLAQEVSTMEEFRSYGFNMEQSKLLLSKFALLSAFKESEFKSGSMSNRYSLYNDVFVPFDKDSGGVVFFNDIEKDESYQMISTDRKDMYTGSGASQLRVSQIPPLRENVHDLIFVMNFSNKHQLKVFFTMAKIILDRGIAQQIGVLPLMESDKDQYIADLFYHILEVGEVKEAMAFLYKYYESKEEEENELFSKIKMPPELLGSYTQYKRCIEDFSLTEASVVINGVIHSMRSNWRNALGHQITHDVKLLQKSIREGSDKDKSLKSVLYSDSKSSRNTHVVPLDPANIRYKKVTKEMIDSSHAFVKEKDSNDISLTFWLIGEFNLPIIRQQFINLLKFMDLYNDKSIQIRVFDTSKNQKHLNDIFESYANKSLKSDDIAQIISMVKAGKAPHGEKDAEKMAILERNHIQSHSPMMLLNSRYLSLTQEFTIKDIEELLEYEFKQRLGIFKEITDAYPDQFSWKPIMHFRKGNLNHLDWFDLVSSTLSNSFFVEDVLQLSDVSRFDFSSLNFANSIDVTGYSKEKPIDLLAIVDPADEFSQKLVSIFSSLSDLSFVNARILLQPLSESKTPNDLSRFYVDGFQSSQPKFDANGRYIEFSSCNFESAVDDTEMCIEIDAPSNWYIIQGKNSDLYDFTKFTMVGDTDLGFTLSKLVVEGYVRDVTTAKSIPGLILEASKGTTSQDAFTMQTMGYSQFRLDPGAWTLQVRSVEDEEPSYDLLSASENKYDKNDCLSDSVPLLVKSLKRHHIYPRMKRTDTHTSHLRAAKEQADINVFSIASGHLYEQLMSTMMLSVVKNTGKSVKFWLIENFLSHGFKERVPGLAEKYGFEYEYVGYQWPAWLRQQKQLHRKVWGHKMLFLDTLFPADLDKVIFVDADQIARTDLKELVNIDLEGAPYGFAPMCDSRKEMEGYQFWKNGYWPTVLKDDLKYHISALYVVDLRRLRETLVGDKLRSHYQKLSADPNSLSNLDQDLPNNLQRQVPIHTLPQEWLWCETWCSDESKSSAKMIDLCNNPKTHEGKIEQAKRVISEWEDYYNEISQTEESLRVHDEL
ncbi:UDP-glucose:Glycoprotein Glucosyltransferase family protein [Clavispora lusitaniae]|uniref:UDP-glucose:Glycoprotein Glucosyltransferase family protein n=1 Tax=Clavispora lusitaniae TaxID=36911 RepID=UPI00202C46F1|nr:UDP-glucose:Glycoprotein Glucosyltransferase family protein [Clavispora lusitaniae]